MNPFFESPLSMTAVYIGSLFVGSTLVIQSLLSIIQNNEDKDNTIILMSKITRWIQYFEEFSLAIFTIMAGANLYFYLENQNIGRMLFNQYSSSIQIGIIIISIFVMNLLSNKFKHNISIDERASLRLLGSIYSVINLIVIREIFNDKSLDTTLICYIGLILGRFIFFDSSISVILLEFRKIGAKFVLMPIMGGFVFAILFTYKKNGIDIVGDDMILNFVSIYCAMLFGLNAAMDINMRFRM